MGTLWDVTPEVISRVVAPEAEDMVRKTLMDNNEEASGDAFGEEVVDLRERVRTLEALVYDLLGDEGKAGLMTQNSKR